MKANYLPLIFLTKEVLILPVPNHCHKDNNIYERDPKSRKAACAYKHYTAERLSSLFWLAQMSSCNFSHLLNCIAEL